MNPVLFYHIQATGMSKQISDAAFIEILRRGHGFELVRSRGDESDYIRKF